MPEMVRSADGWSVLLRQLRKLVLLKLNATEQGNAQYITNTCTCQDSGGG